MAVNVITASNSRTAQLYDGEANAILLVTEGAYIVEARAGVPAYFADGGAARVTIKGTVITYGGYGGLYLGATESTDTGGGNRVSISASGLVEGNNAISLFGGANALVNDGMLRGTGTTGPGGIPQNVSCGVYMRGTGNSIVNNGTITGLYGIYSASGDAVVTNTGVISATGGDAVYAIGGQLTVENSGIINGGISAYNTTGSYVTNTGTINGDVFVVRAYITNYGTIAGGCSGNSGQDVISNYGTISYVNVLDGADYVYNKAGGVIGSITFGVAAPDLEADYCTNDGRVGSVYFSDGADSFVNTGSVESSVAMGNGDNSLTNRGTIGGTVSTGIDADTIFNSGAIDSVFTGTGADRVINTADGVISTRVFIGYTDDASDDILLNSGVIGVDLDPIVSGLPTVAFGDGADRLVNDGTIYGLVDMGAGVFADTVTNAGQLTGGVLLGGGNDVVDTQAGTIDGNVLLGGGDDSYTGGSGADRVAGGGGIDTVDLAGGDDLFRAADRDGDDQVDGGGGLDTYDAGAATLATVIDLEAGTTSGGVGVDQIADFENASGGKGADTLIGNDGSNRLLGGTGGDAILGGGGADRLFGGAGADTITGGGGRDVMTGGAAADRFLFAANSTGATAATRDLITDFADHSGGPAAGADTIGLSAIDANTAAGGNQAFVFEATEGAAFSGTAGSLVWQQEGGFALVLGDVNGDRVADFAIQLAGTHTLTAADFVL